MIWIIFRKCLADWENMLRRFGIKLNLKMILMIGFKARKHLFSISKHLCNFIVFLFKNEQSFRIEFHSGNRHDFVGPVNRVFSSYFVWSLFKALSTKLTFKFNAWTLSMEKTNKQQKSPFKMSSNPVIQFQILTRWPIPKWFLQSFHFHESFSMHPFD